MRKMFSTTIYAAAAVSAALLLTSCENASAPRPVSDGTPGAAVTSEESTDQAPGTESTVTDSIPESADGAEIPDSADGAKIPESADSAKEKRGPLIDHVKGIKDFNVIEGMQPDVMAGISWDDEIGTVVCDYSQVKWDEPGEQELTYVIAAMDQTIERKTIKVTVNPDLDHHIFGMEGNAQVVTGQEFDPMEGVTWDEEIESVTADTSEFNNKKQGEYPVVYTLTSKDGLVQNSVRRVNVVSGGADSWDNSDNASNYSMVIDLGLWRLTAYMDTPEDQGSYVGQTASGAPLIPGQTVAVSAATCSRLGLHFGDKLLIDGHVYTLEDHGGSAMHDQNWVDIFVDNPVDEFSERFNRYSEVYLLR